MAEINYYEHRNDRICDVENGALNTQTYAEFLVNALSAALGSIDTDYTQLLANDKKLIRQWLVDESIEDEFNDCIRFYIDYLWKHRGMYWVRESFPWLKTYSIHGNYNKNKKMVVLHGIYNKKNQNKNT